MHRSYRPTKRTVPGCGFIKLSPAVTTATRKQQGCYYSSLFLLFLLLQIPFLSVLNAQTYKINKYGLKLIEDIQGYQQQVKIDGDRALVPLKGLIGHLKTDFVYATSSNFTGEILYKAPAAYLRKPAAIALRNVANRLEKMGYGLLIYDAYRPYSVTVKMWEVVPDNRYAADPRHGSGHNRGLSVDLSLYYLATGQPVAMPTKFDDFTPRAHVDFDDLPDNILKNRSLLRKVMTEGGFKPLRTEWWHFTYPGNSSVYNLMDLSFKALLNLKR